MDLITYTPDTVQVRSTKATIRFTRNSCITISCAAAKMMGLKSGDSVSLHQDAQNAKDWYIKVDSSGFKLRSGKGNKGYLLHARQLSIKVLDVLEIEGSATFIIAREPVTLKEGLYWPIITLKSILIKR